MLGEFHQMLLQDEMLEALNFVPSDNIEHLCASCTVLGTEAGATSKIRPHRARSQTRPLHRTLSHVVAVATACVQRPRKALQAHNRSSVHAGEGGGVRAGPWSPWFSRRSPAPPSRRFPARIRSAHVHPAQSFSSLTKSSIQSFTKLLLIT